jgi:hypothetical protein
MLRGKKFVGVFTINFSQLPQSGIGILAGGDSCTGGHRLVWRGPAILKEYIFFLSKKLLTCFLVRSVYKAIL